MAKIIKAEIDGRRLDGETKAVATGCQLSLDRKAPRSPRRNHGDATVRAALAALR